MTSSISGGSTSTASGAEFPSVLVLGCGWLGMALARALVTGPLVVFADEPTGALDTVGGEALLDVLLSTTRERGASVVLVTHDNRVAAHADREVVLVDGAFTSAGVRS